MLRFFRITDAFIAHRHRLAVCLLGVISALALASVAVRAEAQTPESAGPLTIPAAPQEPATVPAATPTRTVIRAPSPTDELNTLLMHSTFLIFGPANVPNQTSFGTVFLMGIPYKDDPKIAHIVVVTAAHVFEGIRGDSATLQLRRKSAEGTYTTFLYQFPIRKSGQPLYVRHPTADVAAMYADIPDEVPMTGLSPDSLVTNKSLDDLEFHPGDEAHILGFPAMVGTEGGFPFLRVGRIASYPLTPMKIVKEWAFDAHVFNGNSGGPVYFTSVNRFFKRSVHFGVAQGVLGLVIKEGRSSLPEFAHRDLDYGVVVPAEFIKETLDMLPAPPDEVTGSTK
jgi:hypothetical protein